MIPIEYRRPNEFEREKRRYQAMPFWKKYFDASPVPISFKVFKRWATGRLRFWFWTISVLILIIHGIVIFEEIVLRPRGIALILPVGLELALLIDRLSIPRGFLRSILLWSILFSIPLSLAVISALCAISIIDRRRIPFGFCRNCRYDLRGSDSAVCPECGMPRVPTKTNERP